MNSAAIRPASVAKHVALFTFVTAEGWVLMNLFQPNWTTSSRWSLPATEDLPRAATALLAIAGVQALVFLLVQKRPSLVFAGLFTAFWLSFAWLLQSPSW